MARRTEVYPIQGSHSSLWQLYKTISFWKVMKNFIIIEIGRYTPFVSVKRWMYRTFLRMEIGETTALALKVMPDLMFPERIKMGRNCVIGYNTTLLAHEYLINEYRLGDIIIGDEVMIGANSTVLPGVIIGDRAIISACTLVNKDVPAGAFVGGNPMQIIKIKE